MKYILSAALLAFVHTSVWAARDVPADNNGLVLTIEAINGTANGNPVLGDEVAVAIYQHEELVNTLQSEIGPQGTAILQNLRAGEHMVAVATVFHQGMSFSSSDIVLKPGQRRVNARVQVFDVSYESSLLSVTTHHLIIKRTETSLLLSEFIQLANPSDRAITSSERDAQDKAKVLVVSLPRGYKSFSTSSYLVSEALVFTEEGFYDTMGVPPGKHHIIFSYTLETKSDMMDITKEVSLPTANFVLFSQLGHEQIQGLGDPEGQMALPDGTLGEYYNLGDLSAGAEVRFKVTGLRTMTGDRTSWIIIALVFAAIAVLAFFRLRLTAGRSDYHSS
ncbi:MAG: hypothetical protein ACYST6_15425 [Planctomycetota bacterium]